MKNIVNKENLFKYYDDFSVPFETLKQLPSNDLYTIKQIRELLAKEITVKTINTLDSLLKEHDSSGWILFDQACELFDLNDAHFRNYYHEEINAGSFLNLNGFDLTDKLTSFYINSKGKNHDIVFRNNTETILTMKSVLKIIEFRFDGYNIDIQNNLKNFVDSIDINRILNPSTKHIMKESL